MERFRQRVLPYLGAFLAAFGGIGWLRASIADLDRGDKDRDKIREVAINARDREVSEIKTDIRELRASLMHCKDARDNG